MISRWLRKNIYLNKNASICLLDFVSFCATVLVLSIELIAHNTNLLEEKYSGSLLRVFEHRAKSIRGFGNSTERRLNPRSIFQSDESGWFERRQ